MRRKASTGKGRTKDAREIIRRVKKAGGSVEATQKGHLKVRGPLGVAFVPSDPGSNAMDRAWRTIRTHTGLSV